MRGRRGMSLAVTIGVVSLIAILAVATMSLAGRMVQGSTLALRDARIDAAVTSGFAAAVEEWRSRQLGRLAVGSSVLFAPGPPDMTVSVMVSVTRVGSEVFWVVSEAAAGSGPARRENLILRRRSPDAQAIVAGDSTNVETLDFLAIDSIVATSDSHLAAGASIHSPSGVIHVAGDATVTGGTGSGILIVDGRLAITGPLSFAGLVIARGGISVTAAGVAVNGLIRASGNPWIDGSVALSRSVAVIQDVMAQSLMPVPVSGRRWQELY